MTMVFAGMIESLPVLRGRLVDFDQVSILDLRERNETRRRGSKIGWSKGDV